MVHVEPRCENGSIGLHVEGPNQCSPQDAVVLNTLSYAYLGHQPIISDISLTLPKGSRCLLLGANGAGEPLCPKFTSHATITSTSGHKGEASRALPSHALLHRSDVAITSWGSRCLLLSANEASVPWFCAPYLLHLVF